jgi:hypothetical protein
VTADWIEDACDLLEKDGGLGFVLIGGHYGEGTCYRRHRVTTTEQLNWLRLRFDEWHAEMLDELSHG